MHSLCRVNIALDHLSHNFSIIKRHADNRKILAMVKADAYGHGLSIVAKALPQADGFGVARLEEAMQLRAAGVSQTIAVMSGFQSIEQLAVITELQLDCVLHDLAQLDLLKSVASTFKGRVWIKVDTGMTRLGLSPSDVHFVQQSLHTMGIDSSQWVLMTHLACADEVGSMVTQAQLSMFDHLINDNNIATSVCNSAALLSDTASASTWVRPGLMLYGVSPFPDQTASDFDLLPVMTLRATVIAMKSIAASQRVGYGHAWVSEQPTTIALVGIGYGDGYMLHTVSGVKVSINGNIFKTVGRVSMDLLAVNIREMPVSIGDEVVLWGEGLPIEGIAHQADRSAYEMLSGITTRVDRVIATSE